MVWSVMGLGCWAGWVGWVGWCGEWIGSQRIPCIYVHCMYVYTLSIHVYTLYIILYTFKEEIRGAHNRVHSFFGVQQNRLRVFVYRSYFFF